MNRRHWPAALAILSIVMLGSYLLYTEHLVREIRAEARIHMRMFALVQQGILSPPDAGGDVAVDALAGLQEALIELGIPIVVVNTAGQPTAWVNLPFQAEPDSEADRQRVLEFASRLSRQHGSVFEPAAGMIYFGAPPILGWLRWIPWLQVGGVLFLLLLTVGLIRVDVRAERERMWAAMARELAHQMGTPLSSLAGWLELLRMPAAERQDLASTEHIAGEIGADLERLERVSRRFELIGKPPALEAVSAAALLEDLERYIRPRLPRLASGIQVGTRVLRDVPDIMGNRVLLVWALENIVKNALDALAGRGGRIRVAAARADDGWIRLYVADTGPGIPPGLRDRIFEPGVTSKAGGWGVGLSLARRIVEDVHGGRITARSRRGGGTVFDIELPSVAGPAGGRRGSWWARLSGRLERRRPRAARRRSEAVRSARRSAGAGVLSGR